MPHTGSGLLFPGLLPLAVRARRRRACSSAATREIASASAGTSSVTVVPAPTMAPSPTVTGATSWTSEPTKTFRADRRLVLGEAVVVARDDAGAHVRPLADLGVAEVGQVVRLDALARAPPSSSRRSCRRGRPRRAPSPRAGARTGRRRTRRRRRAPSMTQYGFTVDVLSRSTESGRRSPGRSACPRRRASSRGASRTARRRVAREDRPPRRA